MAKFLFDVLSISYSFTKVPELNHTSSSPLTYQQFVCWNNPVLRLAWGSRSGSVVCNLRDFHSTLGDYSSHTIWDKMVHGLFLFLGFSGKFNARIDKLSLKKTIKHLKLTKTNLIKIVFGFFCNHCWDPNVSQYVGYINTTYVPRPTCEINNWSV